MNPITLRDCESTSESGYISLGVEIRLACEHYFQLGARKIYPIWAQEPDKIIILQAREYSPPLLITALKVLSYAVIIFPLICRFILFCTRDSHYQFQFLQEFLQNSPPAQYKPVYNYKKLNEVKNELLDSLEAYYFHTTSEAGLAGILKDRKVKVMQKKCYRGAFVSTRPELSYGNCVIGFKRTIEKIKRIARSGPTGNDYWIGFNQPIPLLPETVAFIAAPPHLLQSDEFTLPSELNKTPLLPLEGLELPRTLYRDNYTPLVPVEWPLNGFKARAG